MANKLPNNKEAEKAILGAMLTYPTAVVDVLSSLTEDDIFDDNVANKIVFRAIDNLQNKKIPIDIQTVTNELINMKKLEEVGGVDYLVELVDSSIAMANLEFYVKIVKDQAVLRNFLLVIKSIEKEYNEEEIEDISEFVGIAEEKISKVTQKRRVSNFITSEEAAKRVELTLSTLKVTSEDDVTGITSGYSRVNKLTHGFQKGELTIIAARPSVGKTALSLNMAYLAAKKTDVPVAFFSLEMSAELLAGRLISCASMVEQDKIRTGKLSESEKVKVSAGIRELSSVKIFIDETPNIKLMDILAKSRKLYTAHPDLGLIVVDYIGKISTGKKVESRQLEVSNISNALKELARELKVPVIAVCQLSRKVDEHGGVPIMSDLRESGSIEQDADVVMLLSPYFGEKKNARSINSQKRFNNLNDKEKRDANEDMKKRELQNSLGSDVIPLRINIAKNRNGQTGLATLFFYRKFCKFENPANSYDEAITSFEEMSGDEDN